MVTYKRDLQKGRTTCFGFSSVTFCCILFFMSLKFSSLRMVSEILLDWLKPSSPVVMLTSNTRGRWSACPDVSACRVHFSVKASQRHQLKKVLWEGQICNWTPCPLLSTRQPLMLNLLTNSFNHPPDFLLTTKPSFSPSFFLVLFIHKIVQSSPLMFS